MSMPQSHWPGMPGPNDTLQDLPRSTTSSNVALAKFLGNGRAGSSLDDGGIIPPITSCPSRHAHDRGQGARRSTASNSNPQFNPRHRNPSPRFDRRRRSEAEAAAWRSPLLIRAGQVINPQQPRRAARARLPVGTTAAALAVRRRRRQDEHPAEEHALHRWVFAVAVVGGRRDWPVAGGRVMDRSIDRRGPHHLPPWPSNQSD